MSPNDISRVQGVAGVRQDNAVPLRPDATGAAARRPVLDAVASAAAPEIRIDPAPTTDLRTAPINGERVSEIRNAIQSGNYPLFPAQIADAMIAAPMLLSVEA